MIRFPCRCGHEFEEPDDTAGNAVQCPACHLLNDVPLLSDLPSIGLDGTYLLDPHATRAAPDQLGDTVQVFAQPRNDLTQKSLDLRTSLQESAGIGQFETQEQHRRRMKPRYDPETGELVTALTLAMNKSRRMVEPPTPFATPVIASEASGTAKAKGAAQILLDLLRPLNLLVYFFVLVLHFLVMATEAAMAVGLLMIGPIALAMVMAILAHYANTIDEVGVDGQDELPRVLRDMRLYEDIWWPFARVISALAVCFGPAIGILFLPVDPPLGRAMAIVAAMIGTLIFPALILTLQTSGSLANLRPDRLLAVVALTGGKYVAAVVMLVVALVPYAYGVVTLTIAMMQFNPLLAGTPPWSKPLLGLPLLCLGIFMMHAFAWQVGLMYRMDGERFGWVGRYHVREDRDPVIRRKPKYVGVDAGGNPGAAQRGN